MDGQTDLCHFLLLCRLCLWALWLSKRLAMSDPYITVMELSLCCLQGAAIEDGRLRHGDQITAVNGHSLEGVTHAEAVDILKRTKGTVVLTVLS